MKFLLILFTTVFTLSALEIGNGQSIVLSFPSQQGTLEFDDHNYSVIPHPTIPDQGVVILPIDYYTHAHTTRIRLSNKTVMRTIDLNITSVDYPVETLSVDPSKVSPPPEVLARIEAEKLEAETIYNHYTPTRYWNSPFIRPIDSITTSPYGSSRTYNGVLKSYHGGIDFRALTPLPILASNDGTVVLVKERYYTGGTVIIDHGEGLYTCYFHLSEYRVNVGEKVIKGQEIALSGATGRITGPHLHFGVMIHGIQSDPLRFITQIETLFPPFAFPDSE